MANKDVTLKDNQNNEIYPVTRTSNVYNSDGTNLSETLLVFSNPNLLINGDFKINQRGLTTYTNTLSNPSQYTVDRWFMTTTSTCTVISNGVTITPSGADNDMFYQIIEHPERYAGLKVTFSIKFSNNTNALRIKIVDNNGNDSSSALGTTDASGIISVTRTLGSSITSLKCVVTPVNANASFDINWAKLEVGGMATQFYPKPYAQEYSDCLRYYQVHRGNVAFGMAQANSSTIAVCTGSFVQAMRIAPTRTYSGTILCRSGNNYLTASSISGNFGNSKLCFQIQLTTTGLTPGQAIDVFIDTTTPAGYIAFDAELY